MAKYHINNKTGDVRPCTATVRPCPHGDETEHFSSEEEAREAYEKENSSAVVKPPVRKIGSRLENRAAKYSPTKYWADVPVKASDEEIKNALAYAQVNGIQVAITYESKENQEGFGYLDDREEVAELTAGTRKYLIGTPRVELVEVDFEARVDAELDDYWQFHPDIDASYAHYSTLEDYKGSRPTEPKRTIPIESDSVFRKQEGNFNRPSYDRGDSSDAIRAAKIALSDLPKPYEISRIAELKGHRGRIAPGILTSKNYLGHDNSEIRAAVVARKEFPSSSHETALADDSYKVKVALAKRDDISKETMEKLLEEEYYMEYGFRRKGLDSPRSAVLMNSKLPLRLMNKVVREGTLEDMRVIARNPALTEKARATLDSRAETLGVRIGNWY